MKKPYYVLMLLLLCLSSLWGYRDLETGTFITRDPLGFVDGPNVYTYVQQNPWTYFDPQGLSAYGTGIMNGGGLNSGFSHIGPEHAETLLTGLDASVTTAGITMSGGLLAIVKESGRELLNRLTGLPTDLGDLAKNLRKNETKAATKNLDDVNAPKADSVDTKSGAMGSKDKIQAELDTNTQQADNVGQHNQQSSQPKDPESKASNTRSPRPADGSSMKTDDALYEAENYLGDDYTQIDDGVFRSADGDRHVRMTDSDLDKVNNHAAEPHLNFEEGRTTTTPSGRESFKTKKDGNSHVYLPEEK